MTRPADQAVPDGITTLARLAQFVGRSLNYWILALMAGVACAQPAPADPTEAQVAGRGLERIKYNHPGLVVDLGVGLWAWPLPMDYDGDGDWDLVVSCADKPFAATCFFENPGGDSSMPVFKPGVVIGPGKRNCQVSHTGGKVRVTTPGTEYLNFQHTGFDRSVKLPVEAAVHPNPVRANQWKMADYDGDGRTDLVVGVGDWTDYGWDNAYSADGQWTNGPLRGLVYLLRNTGTEEKARYASPVKLEAGGQPIDVYGMPSPNLADFDGDGDLDMICGEFVDKLTWFENVGTRTAPKYATGRYLPGRDGPLRMDLCMIVPVAVDWDGDGDIDLVIGQEDGRVALVENTGKLIDRMPAFSEPKFFRQEADEVKFGALATPVGFDWDGDGDDDLISGNTAGYIGFIENLDGGDPPKWAAPKLLEAGGRVIRIEAGPNGSIQGPCETKWGYTTLSVADWDQDGLADLVVNSIWGKVVWYRNVGTRTQPELAAAEPVEVEWPKAAPKPAWNWWNPQGKELATQWRTTPVVIDLTGDGLNDLVMLDCEGYLALYERKKVDGRLVLLPPERVFYDQGAEKPDTPLRLNGGEAGKSGRRKLAMVDWDLDGKIDLLVNSKSVNFLKNVSTQEGKFVFRDMGPVDARVLAGHTTSPTVVDWDRNGVPDLLVGAEDGYFYYLKNPHRKPGMVRAEFIFTEADFPQCHASTIAESTDGLVAAFFGGTKEKDPDVGVWVSRQEDGKWTRPVEAANGVSPDGKRYPCWNPVLFQTGGGPLLLFYKVGPSPSEWWGMVIMSRDGGRTWSEPRRLPEGQAGPIKNKPIQLADGSLLCGSSTEDDGWRVHMERVGDRGRSWTKTEPLNDGTAIGAIQPTILRHGPETLQILCRTRQGKIADAWSGDGGESWGEMTLTSLPNPNSGIDAVTLADGRHLLVYNHTTTVAGRWGGPRSPLNAAVSRDGKTWRAAMVLEKEPGEFSYPAVIQTSDGLVHATYTWKRRRVKHVVIDPAKLVLEDIVDGRWPE
jgi:predicted neuraminidase